MWGAVTDIRRPYSRATGKGAQPAFWGNCAPGLLVGIRLSRQHQTPRNRHPRALGITPVVSDMKFRACSQRKHVFSKGRPVGGLRGISSIKQSANAGKKGVKRGEKLRTTGSIKFYTLAYSQALIFTARATNFDAHRDPCELVKLTTTPPCLLVGKT